MDNYFPQKDRLKGEAKSNPNNPRVQVRVWCRRNPTVNGNIRIDEKFLHIQIDRPFVIDLHVEPALKGVTECMGVIHVDKLASGIYIKEEGAVEPDP